MDRKPTSLEPHEQISAGSTNTKGNHKKDEFANQDVDMDFIELKPFFGVSKRLSKKTERKKRISLSLEENTRKNTSEGTYQLTTY